MSASPRLAFNGGRLTSAFRALVLGVIWIIPLLAQTPAQQQSPVPQQTPPPQQTPAQTPPPVFRTGASVVPLTVTVLDQKSVPITDLKQSDFTVYENGRQREIVAFFPQAFVPGLSDADRGGAVGPRSRRAFVFVLTDGLFQNVFTALDRLIAFVSHDLGPQDSVALMGFHRTTPFTTDHALIARILERYKLNHRRLIDELWEAEIVTTPALWGTRQPDDPRVVTAKNKAYDGIDALFDGLGPLRYTTDLLLAAHRTVPSRLITASNLLKLAAGVELLRHFDGERQIVFMDSGGLAHDEEDASRVARPAADAHVIVSMIGNGYPSLGSREVVRLTGGYYTTLDYVDKSLGKIDSASRFSYLLGYVPTNSELDQHFRDVEVKVNRHGVQVRFAHGYYAREEPAPVDIDALIAQSRIEVALAYTTTATELPLTVTTLMMPRMGVQLQARVEVAIDASRVAFDLKDGVRTGQLELEVYCADARQNIIGEFGEHLNLSPDEDTYARWLQDGIHRVVRVPLVDKPRYVKVVVYDPISDRVGTKVVEIKDGHSEGAEVVVRVR